LIDDVLVLLMWSGTSQDATWFTMETVSSEATC